MPKKSLFMDRASSSPAPTPVAPAPIKDEEPTLDSKLSVWEALKRRGIKSFDRNTFTGAAIETAVLGSQGSLLRAASKTRREPNYIEKGVVDLTKTVATGSIRLGTRGLLQSSVPLYKQIKGEKLEPLKAKSELGKFFMGKDEINLIDLVAAASGKQNKEEIKKQLQETTQASAELALEALTFGTYSKVKGANVVLKEFTKDSLKVARNKAIIQAATKPAKRFFVGGSLLGTIQLQKEDVEIKTAFKQMGYAGLASALGPSVAALAIKGLGKGMSTAIKKASPGVKAGIAQLEEFATRQPLPNLEGHLGKVQGIYNQGKTTKQVIASNIVKGLRGVDKIYDRLVYSGRPFEVISKQLSEHLGRPLTDEENVAFATSLALPRAAEKSKVFKESMQMLLESYDARSPGVSEKITAYLSALDLADNARLGLKLPGGFTAEEALKGVDIMKKENADVLDILEEARLSIHTSQKAILEEMMDTGLYSKAEFKAMTEAHPNFIPNNKFVEELNKGTERSGLASTLNVSVNKFKRLGSNRINEDPILAMQNYADTAFAAIEKARAGKILRSALKQDIDFLKKSFVLDSVENQIQRETVYFQKKQLMDKVEELKKFYKATNKKDKVVLREIIQLEKDLNKLSEKGLELFFENTDNPLAAREVFLKTTSRSKQVEDLVEKGFNATKRAKISGIDKQIALQKKILEPISEDFFTQVNKIVEGGKKNTPVMVKMRKFDAAQKKLLKLEKEKLATLGEKFVESKTKYRLVSKTDSLKVAAKKLASNFRARNSALKTVKSKIATAEKRLGIKEGVKAMTERDIDSTLRLMKQNKASIKELIEKAKELRKKTPSALDLAEKGLSRIDFMIDGRKETWVVPTRLTAAVKNLDNEKMGALMQFASFMTGTPIVRQLATSKNPSFFLPNFVRDVQSGLINSEYGLAADGLIQGVFKSNPKLFKQAALDGSLMHAGLVGKNSSLRAEALNVSQGVLWKKLVNKSGISMVDEVAETIENASRFSVYMKALQSGATRTEAAYWARNATVDFARSGSMVKTINQFIPFLNARVQGADRFIKTVAKHPEKVMDQLFWTAAVPELYLYSHNRQFETYENIPQWFIDRYWVVMIGETPGIDSDGNEVLVPQYFTLPKGEPQKVLANPLNHLLKTSDGIDKRGTSEVIWDTIGSFSPVSVASGSSEEFFQSLVSMVPTARLGFGLASNIDPFTGYNIIPASRTGGEDRSLEVKKTTTETGKFLAGLVDMSPATLEFIADTMGGLPKDVLRAGDIVTGKQPPSLTGTTFGSISKIPVLRSVVRESDERDSLQNVRLNKEIDRIQKSQKTESIKKRDISDTILTEIYKVKPEERETKIINMLSSGVIKIDQLEDVLEKMETSTTFTEGRLKGLTVEGGFKAEAIYGEYKKLKTPKEQNDFLVDLAKKKILSEKVLQQIKILMVIDSQK